MGNNIAEQFNIPLQCKRYGLPVWQCPQFLFLVMGLLIIIVSVVSYLVGSNLVENLEIVALIDIIIVSILLVISFVITKNFEKLAEVSRMKSEFIGIVTHQLRSPLTNLKWAIDFLTSKDFSGDKEKKEEYYSGLRENTARMVELVDDLLVVSRMEQANLPLNKKEISFELLVREEMLRFRTFAEASNIDLTLKIENKIPLVLIDASQMKLVVENLIDNAIKYTKGGGEVNVFIRKEENNVVFKIKDNGVGIPEQDQKFIFKKFFRSRNALREQTHGSGLGLYIVKAIIEKSGGKIWFESKQNQGTSFFFTIPL